MIDWHASTCRRPDLRFLPGLEAQACFSCGGVDTVAESSSANVARNFDLRWPTSLPFMDDAADDNGSVGPPSLISPASNSAVEGVTLETTTAATDFGKDTTALAKTSLYTSLYARKIRLIRLLPGKYNDPITCDIRVVDLQSKPEYEALSYTWADSNGDTSLSETLHVKGHHNILRITTNCANALRRLRFPFLRRVLWVDAICIDQNNSAERSHQVGIMQYIYATAERVLVYLGEGTEDPDPETFVPWKYENQGNTLDLSTDLGMQSYFTRVWVIQEIASARSAWILLGAKGARWDDFLKPPDTDDIDYRSMCIMNYEFLKARHPWLQLVSQPRHKKLKELCSFLFATEQCQASDPRDKVFALLGLFIDTKDAGLVPDYTLSLSEVIVGLTAFLFQQNTRSWPLLFAMASPSSLGDRPNWAVDWSRPTNRKQIMPGLKTRRPALPGATPRFCKNGALVLKGIPLLTLANCTLTKQAAEASSGIIKGIRYEPYSSKKKRELQLKNSSWARKGDNLYAIKGLCDHLLILRPLEYTNKQSFVGICESVNTELSAVLINLLDMKKALLFSTWNEILDHGIEDWSTPEAWSDLKDACSLIQTYCKFGKWAPTMRHWDENIADSLSYVEWSKGPHGMPSAVWEYYKHMYYQGGSRFRRGVYYDELTEPAEYSTILSYLTVHKNPLLDLRQALHRFRQRRQRRNKSRKEYTKPGHKDSCTLRIKPKSPGGQDQIEIGLTDLLLPICWYYGEDQSLKDEDPVPSHYWKSGNEFPWRPGCLDSSAERFWQRLGAALRSEINYDNSGYESAKNFLRRLIGQKLSVNSRKFEGLLHYYYPHMNLKGEEENVSLLRWIRNSLELVPNRNWQPEWHFNKSEPKTWAHNFCKIWGVLSWRPGLNSDDTPKQMVYEGIPDPHQPLGHIPKHTVYEMHQGNEKMMIKIFEEELNAGMWAFKAGFEERAWHMLFELAQETTAHLLPLENAFQRQRGGATCANKTEEMKWEDVYIV